MYSRKRFCPDGTRSRHRLIEPGITWTGHNIEENDSDGKESGRLTGWRNVPTLIIGERIFVEPSKQHLDDALATAGYDFSE